MRWGRNASVPGSLLQVDEPQYLTTPKQDALFQVGSISATISQVYGDLRAGTRGPAPATACADCLHYEVRTRTLETGAGAGCRLKRKPTSCTRLRGQLPAEPELATDRFVMHTRLYHTQSAGNRGLVLSLFSNVHPGDHGVEQRRAYGYVLIA